MDPSRSSEPDGNSVTSLCSMRSSSPTNLPFSRRAVAGTTCFKWRNTSVSPRPTSRFSHCSDFDKTYSSFPDWQCQEISSRELNDSEIREVVVETVRASVRQIVFCSPVTTLSVSRSVSTVPSFVARPSGWCPTSSWRFGHSPGVVGPGHGKAAHASPSKRLLSDQMSAVWGLARPSRRKRERERDPLRTRGCWDSLRFVWFGFRVAAICSLFPDGFWGKPEVFVSTPGPRVS